MDTLRDKKHLEDSGLRGHCAVEELVIQAEFWKDRRVLLTGHTGFKGAGFACGCRSMGARVVGYALPPATQPNLFELARVEQQMVSILADVRDAERLRQRFHDHQPEVVFHLAAQAWSLPSYAQPVDTYSTNVMGTVNLARRRPHRPGSTGSRRRHQRQVLRER
jgi:CDP-glucose 4,6-dehydratase